MRTDTGTEGRRVLITGANRGIGLGLVEACLAHGDRVFAGCRKPREAAKLRTLAATHPDCLFLLALDVIDETAIARAAQAVQDQARGLDLLVNNAGIFPSGNALSSLEVETLLHTMEVNAIAPVMVARACVPLLKRGNHPVIINVSSDSGSLARKTTGRDYGYCASKAALNMLTRTLAHDLRHVGIIVLALHPGWVRTDMGGRLAPLKPAESARSILALADRLTLADSGRFLDRKGRPLPW
jgi:NAD(P)-dependent dehydrogenase (short-subunit alcohol dehydrogenase family)